MVEELLLTNNKVIAHKILDKFEYDKRRKPKPTRSDGQNNINPILSNALERIVSYTANIAECFINVLGNTKIK